MGCGYMDIGGYGDVITRRANLFITHILEYFRSYINRWYL